MMRQPALALCICLTSIATMPAQATAQSEVWVLDTPDGYQRMGGAATIGPYSSHAACESVRSSEGGFQNNPQARCRQVSSGSTGSGGGGVSSGYDWRMDLTQTAISSFMDGWRRGREMARQRAMMEEQRRQMDMVAARERAAQAAIAREEERRQRELAFQRGKASLRELMGLPEPAQTLGGLRREGGAGGTLGGLRREGDTGAKLPGLMTAPSRERAQPTVPGRLYCSAAIAMLASEASLSGRTDESVYLLSQSQRAFNGEALEVQCPEGSASPPEIGAIKCTVRRDGRDVPVPCDDEPLRRFYPDLLESTGQEIDRLMVVRQRFPDLPRAKRDAGNNVREKTVELERARTEEARQPPPAPTPAPVPRPKPAPCSSELCKEAQRELEEARRREREVDEAVEEEGDARSALERNAVLLRGVRSNPAGVSNLLSAARGRPKPR